MAAFSLCLSIAFPQGKCRENKTVGSVLFLKDTNSVVLGPMFITSFNLNYFFKGSLGCQGFSI
jgi:hypothetical protein